MEQITSNDKETNDKDDLEILKVNGYTVGRQLGTGSYSRVLLIHKDNGSRAVKVISKVKCPQDYLEDFLPKELEIFPTLSHENIIRCFDVLESPTSHYIIMEFADRGSLLERIQNEGQIEEPEAKGIFRKTVRAVQYCHEQGIAHRDLKIDNVLLTNSNGITKVKLSDFGFATRTRNHEGGVITLTAFCGSPPFTAPEVLIKKDPYDGSAADVWSLGIILYCMLYFRMPFSDKDVPAMIQDQLERRISFPTFPAVSGDGVTLIKAILEPDVVKRVSAEAILKSTWFEQ